jgi:hypothetical protein
MLEYFRRSEIEHDGPESAQPVEQGRDDKQKVEYGPAHTSLKPVDHEGEIQQALSCKIKIPVEYFHMSKQEDRQEQTGYSLKQPE